MQLKATGKEILLQISEVISQLSNNEYAAELKLLNENTIGKHVRHIIEFFEILVEGAKKGLINYDKRKHLSKYETDTAVVLNKIKQLMIGIDDLHGGNEMVLEVSYTKSDEDSICIKSSVNRELVYNIEHAIHHMAIIKIAIQTYFPKVHMTESFGVAYSTVRYRRSSIN